MIFRSTLHRFYLTQYYIRVDKPDNFTTAQHISKALYYSKLEGCEQNESYSYAPYLYTLYENYPNNKNYMKVVYAMLHYTKLNANKYFQYSNFEQIEQNLSTILDAKEISYITENYQTIITDECALILSDHNEIPTDEKLMRYAFPLD